MLRPLIYSWSGSVRPHNNIKRSVAVVNRFCNFSSATTSEEALEFRRQHELVMKGTDADSTDFHPVISYEKFNIPFDKRMINVMSKEGFAAPTAIQAQSWPVLMKGRDIISVARTGSGKTLGFLLPALQTILNNIKEAEGDELYTQGRRGQRRRRIVSKPKVLVLAPTRELVMQINEEACKYGYSVQKSCNAVFGGAPRGPQLEKMKRGVDMIIGTPGRLNDFASTGGIDLSNIKYLVLDEADRMLDMGFEPQVRSILEHVPEDRQTVFFTATWPTEVQDLATDFVNNPIQINVGDSSVLNANKNIEQNMIMTSELEKMDKLIDIFCDEIDNEENNPSQKSHSCPKSIIFVSRKASCNQIADALREERFRVGTISGDLSQRQRDTVMDKFRNGVIRVLVATDVCGRGIDIPDIENVVNYDFPESGAGVEDYVHRIGRTGRGNRNGKAFTFLTQKNLANKETVQELLKLLKRSEQEIIPEIEQAYARMKPQNKTFKKQRYNRGGEWHRNKDRYDSYGGRSDRFGGRNDRFGGGENRFGDRKDRFGGRNNRYDRRDHDFDERRRGRGGAFGERERGGRYGGGW